MAGKKKSKTAEKSKKTVVVDGEEMELEESLERARIALESSQAHMLSLHKSWRSQLQKMSILSLFLVLKQASIPIQDCLEQCDKQEIGTVEKAQLVIGDSLMEILSVACCLSLVLLLTTQNSTTDFSSLPFKLAVAFVPLIVATYYLDPTVGCMGDSTEEQKPRSFPVTLILLAVCFGSLYVMQYQQRQQTENLQKVQKLKDDLMGTKKEK